MTKSALKIPATVVYGFVYPPILESKSF